MEKDEDDDPYDNQDAYYEYLWLNNMNLICL